MGGIVRSGFLTAEERQDLTELARDGSAEHRLARRANALVLLDRGMSCAEVGAVLLIDDDTIRTWHRLYTELLHRLGMEHRKPQAVSRKRRFWRHRLEGYRPEDVNVIE